MLNLRPIVWLSSLTMNADGLQSLLCADFAHSECRRTAATKLFEDKLFLSLEGMPKHLRNEHVFRIRSTWDLDLKQIPMMIKYL